MASSISYEYLKSIEAQPNGLATLDGSGQIPASQLPATSEVYKGEFATDVALATAFPNGAIANYAYITSTSTYWYWNEENQEWVNQEITSNDYDNLTADEKKGVPYLVI